VFSHGAGVRVGLPYLRKVIECQEALQGVPVLLLG
jgi:hypothetical protein